MSAGDVSLALQEIADNTGESHLDILNRIAETVGSSREMLRIEDMANTLTLWSREAHLDKLAGFAGAGGKDVTEFEGGERFADLVEDTPEEIVEEVIAESQPQEIFIDEGGEQEAILSEPIFVSSIEDPAQALAQGKTVEELVAAGFNLNDIATLSDFISQMDPESRRILEMGGSDRYTEYVAAFSQEFDEFEEIGPEGAVVIPAAPVIVISEDPDERVTVISSPTREEKIRAFVAGDITGEQLREDEIGLATTTLEVSPAELQRFGEQLSEQERLEGHSILVARILAEQRFGQGQKSLTEKLTGIDTSEQRIYDEELPQDPETVSQLANVLSQIQIGDSISPEDIADRSATQELNRSLEQLLTRDDYKDYLRSSGQWYSHPEYFTAVELEKLLAQYRATRPDDTALMILSAGIPIGRLVGAAKGALGKAASKLFPGSRYVAGKWRPAASGIRATLRKVELSGLKRFQTKRAREVGVEGAEKLISVVPEEEVLGIVKQVPKGSALRSLKVGDINIPGDFSRPPSGMLPKVMAPLKEGPSPDLSVSPRGGPPSTLTYVASKLRPKVLLPKIKTGAVSKYKAYVKALDKYAATGQIIYPSLATPPRRAPYQPKIVDVAAPSEAPAPKISPVVVPKVEPTKPPVFIPIEEPVEAPITQPVVVPTPVEDPGEITVITPVETPITSPIDVPTPERIEEPIEVPYRVIPDLIPEPIITTPIEIPEPVADPVPVPIIDPTPRPGDPDPIPDPIILPDPVEDPDPGPGLVIQPDPDPIPDPVPDPTLEPVPEPIKTPFEELITTKLGATPGIPWTSLRQDKDKEKGKKSKIVPTLRRRVEGGKVVWTLYDDRKIRGVWGPYGSSTLLSSQRLSGQGRDYLKRSIAQRGDWDTRGLDLLLALVATKVYDSLDEAEAAVLPWIVLRGGSDQYLEASLSLSV